MVKDKELEDYNLDYGLVVITEDWEVTSPFNPNTSVSIQGMIGELDNDELDEDGDLCGIVHFSHIPGSHLIPCMFMRQATSEEAAKYFERNSKGPSTIELEREFSKKN